MANEVSAPPPYVSYEQNPPPGGSVSYPTQSLPYPAAGPPQGAPPSVAPPSYSSSVQDPSKGYPQQVGPVPYPQQGIAYPYGQPGYPVQGSATGFTTQGVGVGYNQHTQTTIITQQPGGVIVQNVLPPPDYLAVSIVGAFCCFCIGVFAILKSLKSRDMYRMGDSAQALRFGLEAKKLAHISIFVAICTYVFIVVLRIVLSVTLNG